MSKKILSAWQDTKGSDFLRTEKQLSHPIRKMIVDNMRGKKVLDCGCASCIDYPLWTEKKISYTGVDVTKKFLDYAKKLYPGILLYHRNVSKMPFKDQSYPTVYAKDLLEHLEPETYKRVLREMWRVTGRRMMIAFYLAPWQQPTKYGMIKDLHYVNHYNKQEIIDFLESLPNTKIVSVEEGIGDNNSALYTVDRVKSS